MPGDALPLCSGGRPRARPPSVPRLPSASARPPSASGAKCQGGVESERKDKWRRKITAVLRTNERSNERKKDNDKNMPSPPPSLIPSPPRRWMDGGIDMPRFAMPAPFEEIGLTDATACDADTAATNNARARRVVGRSVGMAGGLGGAGTRCRGWPMRKKGLTHTRKGEPAAPVHSSRCKNRPKF